MSSLKTKILALVLAAGTATPTLAIERQPLDMFATCAGRLSAQMEFQWLFGDDAAEITEMRRAAVLDLLAAVMEPGQEMHVLATRIAAKQAHSALLTRATFNDDDTDAAWAASMANEHQAACLSFLLS